MTEHNQDETRSPKGELSRRDMMVMSVAAGLVASTAPMEAAERSIVAKDVEIKMPDGVCDAVFIHPASGSHAGVLIWPDAFGLRPSMREFGRRLAADGYSVLVPNPYYRTGKAGSLNLDAKTFNFQNADDMARLRKLMSSLNEDGSANRDAVAYVTHLDAQPAVDKKKKIGTQGYCMGGPLVLKTCAAMPDRVGAGASFHGGGLVTDQSNSPHLLAPKIKAHLYIGVAANDDARQPDAKDKLREAFHAANVPAEIEVYGSQHGWCVPDMPEQNGKPIYNHDDGERAWAKLLALYKTAVG